ncbi:hypothetical protein PUN28_017781 [Cardiocondyla obscurior]|uniref:Uncharacterized protein n=1 Tax=Cardiocondyla obscurior TaxID=286306 RepID=A0AAW2EK87_9HYME
MISAANYVPCSRVGWPPFPGTSVGPGISQDLSDAPPSAGVVLPARTLSLSCSRAPSSVPRGPPIALRPIQRRLVKQKYSRIIARSHTVRKKKDILNNQLNMRCKADRAKLKGSDCWECRKYYNELNLSEEELQKRKNLTSRHRHKYKRPITPEGIKFYFVIIFLCHL